MARTLSSLKLRGSSGLRRQAPNRRLLGLKRLTPPPFTPIHMLPSRSMAIDRTSLPLRLYRSAALWRKIAKARVAGSNTSKPDDVPRHNRPSGPTKISLDDWFDTSRSRIGQREANVPELGLNRFG